MPTPRTRSRRRGRNASNRYHAKLLAEWQRAWRASREIFKIFVIGAGNVSTYIYAKQIEKADVAPR